MVMVNSDIQWFHCKYIFPHALLLLEVFLNFFTICVGVSVRLFPFEYLFGSLVLTFNALVLYLNQRGV